MKTIIKLLLLSTFLLSLLACPNPASTPGPSTTTTPTPSDFTATAQAGSNYLTWKSVSGATSYNIYWSNQTGVTPSAVTAHPGTVVSPSRNVVLSPAILRSVTKMPGIIGTSFTHASLQSGIAYYYIITAVSASGESTPSSQISSTPLPSPLANPTGLSATPQNAQILLNWTAVTGATSYNLYWSSTAGLTTSNGTKISGLTLPSYSLTGLTNGTLYYFLVTASSSSGESSPSTIASAMPSSTIAPQAPSNFTAAAGNSQVILGWTTAPSASSYNLYWSTSNTLTIATGTKVSISSNTTYTLTGLTNGTPYYFILTAVISSAESFATSVITATPNTSVAPPTPTAVSATAGNTQATVSWTASPGATSYNVYWSTTSGLTPASSTKVSNVSNPAIVQGLTNGSMYYFLVSAVNSIGESSPSSQVSTTPQVPPTSAPTGLVATSAPNSTSLSWTACAGSTGYNLYWSNTNGVTTTNGTKISGITSTSYAPTGLVSATTYYYILTSLNVGGESAPSTQVSVTIPPSSPTGLTVTSSGSTKAVVAWASVSGATSYNLYYSTTAGLTTTTSTKIPGITSSNYTHNGLSAGVSYYYIVTAVGVGGESSPSEQAWSSTSASPPAVPTGLAVVPGTGQNSISWTAVTGATSYNLYWSTNFGVNPSNGNKISGLTINFYAHSALASGSTYYYVITSVGVGGESSPSTQASGTTTPSAPTGLAAVPGSGLTTVSWNASAGATSYNLYWSNTFIVNCASATKISGLTGSSYTHTGLSSGTAIYYLLTAVSAGGESAVSNQASTTIAYPAPSGFTAVAGSGQITLTWSAVTGATSYNLYWATVLGVNKISGTKIQVPSGLTYTHTGLPSGATYYYIVTALGAGSESPASSQVSATVLYPAPATPTGVTASAGVGQNTLNWPAVSGASSYNVYYSTSPSVSVLTGTKVSVSSTTYTHTSLTSGITYYYIVTAYSSGGESGPSTQVSATVAYPVAGVPIGFIATASVGQIDLTWSAVSGATSYNLYWGPTPAVAPGNGNKVSNLSSSTYTHFGLTAGTCYYYVVTAVSPGGESAASATVSATPLYPVPGTPTGLAPTAGIGQNSLTWTAPVSGTVTGYNLYWATTPGVTPGNGNLITLGASTNYTHSGLVQGIPYYYVITSIGPGGESSPTTQVTSTTLLLTGSPTGLTAIAGVNQVSLAWNSVVGSTSYNLYWSTSSSVAPGNGNKISNISSPLYTQTSLASGTTFYYVVTSVSSGGESSPSSSCAATVLYTPPNIPASFTSSPGIGQVTLNWSAVTGATSYNLYWSTSPALTVNTGIAISVTGTTYTHCGLISGTIYYYIVCACGPGGQSAPSNQSSAVPLALPPTPLGVMASPGVETTTISWNIATGATSYNIYWSPSTSVAPGNGTKISVYSGTSNTITSLPSGSTYYYVVTSVSSAGESFPSSIVAATVLYAPPSAPTGLLASGGTNNTSLSWNPVSGATSYNLYWSTNNGFTINNGNQISGITGTGYTHNGLTAGTTYYYLLCAVGPGGQSLPSVQSSATALAPPAGTPLLFDIVLPKVPGQVTLSWSAVTGATSYTLYYGQNSNITPVSGSKIPFITGTTYTQTGLTPGSTYYYILTATSSGGESNPTSPVSETVAYSPPLAPSGLSAIPGLGQVTLSWTAPVSGTVTGYNIYWQTTPGPTTLGNKVNTSVPMTVYTSYNHIGLSQAQTYWYVVTAYGPGGESALSNTASTTTYVSPATPTNFTVTPVVGGNTISWSPVANATGYTLYWSTQVSVSPSNGMVINNVNSPYTQTSGLTDGTTYYYCLTATGTGGYVSSATATQSGVPQFPVPSTPSIALTPQAGSMVISWAQLANATAYQIYWSSNPGVTTTNGSLITVNSGTQTSVVQNGLTSGTTYYYIMTASNATGTSLSSPQVSAVVPLPATPAPTGLVATAGNTLNTLSWTPVSGATSYNLYWSTIPGFTISSGTAIPGVSSPYSHTGRTNGIAYYYIVTAIANGIESVGSNWASATPYTPVPSVPVATATGGNLSNTITWTDSTNATSYNLYWGGSGLAASGGSILGSTGSAAGVVSPYTHSGLGQGQQLYYIVAAVGPGGTAYSAAVHATTNATTAPTNVTAETKVVDRRVDLSWTPVSGATGYTVYYSTTSGVTPANGTPIAVTSASCNVANLTDGTTYYFVVTASSASGVSPASTQISAVPMQPVPAAPTGVTMTKTPGNMSDPYVSFTAYWNAVPGATSYTITVNCPDWLMGVVIVNANASATSYSFGSFANASTESTGTIFITANNASGSSAPAGGTF